MEGSDVSVVSNIKVGTKPVKKLPKLKHSNWYLTINTNQVFQPDQEGRQEFINKFKDCMDNVLGKRNILKYISIKEPGVKKSKESIQSISVEAALEIGGKQKSVH